MVKTEAGTSSNAAPSSGSEYQVFLNFRGPDTRHGFTDFLYHGLQDAGVHVFRDNEKLRVGEVIGGNLLCAINKSRIYVPIFSKTYASSKWCLRELAHIVGNASELEGKRSILPIFFHVEPEDVKLKTSLYSEALLEHTNKFPDEVEAWRKALAEVAEIKGWNMKDDQSQAMIVKLVVERVLEILELKQRLVPEHLVGVDDRVKHLIELLDVNHHDVRLIRIYGMGGIGKTTIAKVVFNKLSFHFGKYCSFLEDVRESMLTKDGIVRLQKKLLSDIVDSGSTKGVKDSEQGMRRIGQVLGTKKVLVVLDDVDNEDHIKKLIGNNPLHLGSRIIITTRNKTILQYKGFKGEIILYEMLKMDDAHAFVLFCRHAFGRDFPSDGYHALSSEIFSSMGGLPLAVKVIGSLLYEKDKSFWKETLFRLKNVPEEEIMKKLRISYDDLDKYQQEIFLDIACFFVNKKKTDAIYMWEGCQFYPERGINVLIDRCLIKILDDDKFWMHDKLIDMGRRIVHQESPNDPSKRSRLWIAKEAFEIIRTEERKDNVQALEMDGLLFSLKITNEEFERFPNLRFLKLNSVTFVGDFAKCHSKLKWISIEGPFCFMADFKANNMYLNDLVVFKLDCRFVLDNSKAWNLIKRARNLKVLSLNGCCGITTIPDISECLSLKRLTLVDCRDLKRIESYIGKLQFLIELEIKKCTLTNLPEEVGALGKLQRLSLQGCSSLRELPSSLGNLTSLIELDLLGTRIRELPNSIGELSSLYCTGICESPSTISMLRNIGSLSCRGIEVQLLTYFTRLLLKSRSLHSVLNLSNFTNLVELQLHDGYLYAKESNLVTGCNLRWIGTLSRLEKLNLKLLNVRAPSELACLSHLKDLVLSDLDLKPLMQFPSSDWSWRNLSTLELDSCEVEDIPLEGLPRLEKFVVQDCARLCRLSISSGLMKLRKVDVSRCPELVEIQVGGFLKSLEGLTVNYCESLTRISGLSYLKNLKRLCICGCKVLTNVEGLDELESLEFLWVTKCKSLRRFIDVSLTKIPDDCKLSITKCGHSIRDSKEGMSLNRYKEEILWNTSNKDEAERDESGEPADVRLSWQRGEVVEHHESTCKATTEVEDEGDLSSVKRDRTAETDRMPTKTGRGSWTKRGSNPGGGAGERGRERGIASSSRNSNASRPGSGAASTSGKSKASNSGRSISSISRSSVTLSSGRDTILSSGRGRFSSSRRDTTNMGASSTSGRSIASSSQSSSTLSTGRGTTKMGASLRSGADKGSSIPRSSTSLSIGRGRGLTSGKGASASLGRGTAKMAASSKSGADKSFSNPRSSTTLSIGSGRGLTSGKGAGVNSGRYALLSLGRGASLRSGTDKGSRSAKTKPRTLSS